MKRLECKMFKKENPQKILHRLFRFFFSIIVKKTYHINRKSLTVACFKN